GTDRMPLLVHAVRWTLAVHGEPVELARETDRKIAYVDHLLHFAKSLGEDLAVLHGDEPAEIFFRLAQRVAERAHHFATPRRGHETPGLEGAQSLFHHGFIIGVQRLAHASDGLAGRRILGDDLRAARVEPAARAGAGVGRADAEPLEHVGRR